MKVWVVIHDVGNPYEPYPTIVGIYSEETKAYHYIANQKYPHNYDTEEWEVDE